MATLHVDNRAAIVATMITEEKEKQEKCEK